MKEIIVNPRDWDGMLDLMDRADEFKVPYMGENENGEFVQISINEDNITVVTNQDNGWVRQNVYYRDFTTEELFDGKWK